MQIALEVLAPDRGYGRVSQVAMANGVSRQTVYEIARRGQAVLLSGLEPGGHGPGVSGQTIEVDRNRLARGTVVLSEAGVSQRNVVLCLSELLDTAVSPSWVKGVLATAEQMAAQINDTWQPQIKESLAGDEIYANGQPNLLLIGNCSLYIYALSRQPSCDGDTWGCVLLDSPATGRFASDAGLGLAAGVKAAGIIDHQLDWDHLLRPLWGQAARLEQQAYAALQRLEDRAAAFEQATTEKRLQPHLAKWDQLRQQADQKIAQFDAFDRIARQVDDCFALIDRLTGLLPDVPTMIERLQTLADQLQGWSGRIYQKLSSHLRNWPPALFSYQPRLALALQPLQAHYGPQAIAALARLWQLEADHHRRPLAYLDHQHQQRCWEQCLDQAVTGLGPQLWTVWDQLASLLNQVWRGSMWAECVNSLLRPLLAGRKHTDQGALDLFRFWHNVHPFQRGKRAGFSPAQLVGLELPDDPLILLGFEPKVSI
jgi:hypothetical protein